MMTDRSVLIDYLAFSAPLSCMKDVHTFQEKGHEWRKYEFLPSYRHYEHSRFTETVSGNDYEALPDSYEVFSSSIEDINRKAERYNKELLSCLHSRLRRFIAAVFGLFVGPARGTGGFAYQDSAVLYSENGGYEHFGMIYWGGNNGTFYVQIGGKGCTHVMSGTTPEKIYKWLKHLDITSLKRLDLATDDYDGVFTCHYALSAYKDDTVSKAGDVDLSALTSNISFSGVIVAVMAIAGSIITLLAAIAGVKHVLKMVRGA
ncbi:hypothetical protein L7750_19465 [Xenorhabdus bovienii]|uniref:hypothetical protein n=1 Tax=Xenorhabdus bovienii TaxID=40576 RepID=UPI001EDFC060|nr:hypothetical protein [Xenorhabdus bovienii]MCG3472465.1 hypothetical protein [Xenorhabdus bovienii]